LRIHLNRWIDCLELRPLNSPYSNMSMRKFTFVVAVNNRTVLETNLLASPCFRSPHKHQILIQEGFRSAGNAYNDAIGKSQNEFLIFVHQDMILPERWMSELETSLDYLDKQDPVWGVLGCYGKTQDDGGRGYVYQAGPGIIGTPFERPEPVQTLDEIVLIFRKSSGLKFDETLPHYHLYGTDICLQAQRLGRTSYAIPAFCIHNSNQGFILPKEFYECYWHVRNTWKAQLPIQASCIRITRTNFQMYKRRFYEIYFPFRHPQTMEGQRVRDVRKLMEDARTNSTRSETPEYVEV